MVRAIVVAHGNLAVELLDTARRVYGAFEGCVAVSNDEKSPVTLVEELEAIVDEEPDDDGCVLFVDFFGGSCCHACLRVGHQRSHVRVVTGVNLPMVVAFLYKRDEVPFDELPREVVARGHASVRTLNAEEC